MVGCTSSPTSVSGDHYCIIYINDIYTSKNEVRGSVSQHDFNYNLKKFLGELTISISFKKTNIGSEILSVLRIEGKKLSRYVEESVRYVIMRTIREIRFSMGKVRSSDVTFIGAFFSQSLQTPSHF